LEIWRLSVSTAAILAPQQNGLKLADCGDAAR
jgi:hypothetical protein